MKICKALKFSSQLCVRKRNKRMAPRKRITRSKLTTYWLEKASYYRNGNAMPFCYWLVTYLGTPRKKKFRRVWRSWSPRTSRTGSRRWCRPAFLVIHPESRRTWRLCYCDCYTCNWVSKLKLAIRVTSTCIVW